MGLLVTGLTGGEVWGKLKLPGDVSWSNLPVPWPRSSWLDFCVSFLHDATENP